MTTIPARLAQTSKISSSPSEARKRAIQLYREWYRSVRVIIQCLSRIQRKLSINIQAPEIVSLYALNVSPAQIRYAIRQRFEKNRYVTDPGAVDVLLQKGREEYQETMNCWKQ